MKFLLAILLPSCLCASPIDMTVYIERNIIQLTIKTEMIRKSNCIDYDYYYMMGRLTSYLDIREMMISDSRDCEQEYDMQDKLNSWQEAD